MKEEKLFTLKQIKKAFFDYLKNTETFGERKLSPESWRIYFQASWSKFRNFLKGL